MKRIEIYISEENLQAGLRRMAELIGGADEEEELTPLFEALDEAEVARKREFRPGDVVVFTPDNFNPSHWRSMSESDKVKYYGPLGYGAKKTKLFVYMTSIRDADGHSGHCVLLDMDDGHLEYMRHDTDFRLATAEEF